jgi:hypothetical protein
MFFNPQLKLFEKPALSTAVETARLAASSNRSSSMLLAGNLQMIKQSDQYKVPVSNLIIR